MEPATAAIHGGTRADGVGGAFPGPVFQSAAFAHDSAEEMAAVFAGRAPGFLYSRISNPTTLALESRMAALDGGIGAIATASGMAAIALVCLSLLKPGDDCIVSRGIFGGTVSLFTHLLPRLGIGVRFVDAGDAAAPGAALTPRTRLLFAETITNPSMEVPDLAAWSDAARAAGVPLVVDATVTTPALASARALGADLAVYSTTKFINGHGSALGGAVVDTGRTDWASSPFKDLRAWARKAGPMAFLAYLRNRTHRDLGACAAPMNAWLTLQGLETLHARMAIACSNALLLARFLETHGGPVHGVRYPGLSGSPYRERVHRQFGGAGGAILTFDLASREAAFACLNRFRLAKRMANLGDVRTLVLHPASTIFAEFPVEERHALGAPEGRIRVAVGLEDADDLCRDFDQALSGAF